MQSYRRELRCIYCVLWWVHSGYKVNQLDLTTNYIDSEPYTRRRYSEG